MLEFPYANCKRTLKKLLPQELIELESWALTYLELLFKWGKNYNLTAISDPNDWIVKHLLDSWSILSLLPKTGTILDAGTGAGLPGLALAAVRTDLNFVLLDKSEKKIHFLEYVISKLKMLNVQAEHARLESYKPGFLFSGFVSRAFSKIDKWLLLTKQLADLDSVWIAMKGDPHLAQQEQIPKGFSLNSIKQLNVPGLNAQRCAVIIRRSD